MNYIRVSASYLFNIIISDEKEDLFLLVKSDRRDQYQPIGGCYKYFPEAIEFLTTLGFVPEKKSNGVDSSFDIRMAIPEENIELFLNWYNSGKGRETSFYREFIEEVVNYLPEEQKQNFSKLCCELIKKGVCDIFFDDEKKIKSIKPMDIIAIKLTPVQFHNIRQLVYSNSSRFILATRKDIENGFKLDDSFNKLTIGAHTYKILIDKNYDKISKKR